MWWVYENKGLGKENRAVVHRGECTFCRDGKGLHEKMKPGGMYNEWQGPYPTRQEAINYAESTGKILILCSRCC